MCRGWYAVLGPVPHFSQHCQGFSQMWGIGFLSRVTLSVSAKAGLNCTDTAEHFNAPKSRDRGLNRVKRSPQGSSGIAWGAVCVPPSQEPSTRGSEVPAPPHVCVSCSLLVL